MNGRIVIRPPPMIVRRCIECGDRSTISTQGGSAMDADTERSRLRHGLRRLTATCRNGWEVMRFGGLVQDEPPSPYEVVDSTPTYRLRRYFPDIEPGGPIALFVPPLMYTADVFDIDIAAGPVSTLQRAGLAPWVVDFGSPATEENGWRRDLADHVLAVASAVEYLRAQSNRDVHLIGYCQGGMFCYQAAAYLQGVGVASIVTIASMVDWDASSVPFGPRVAGYCADRVGSSPPITDPWLQVWFNLVNPVTRMKRRISLLRQLHDREAMLPNERRRRFVAGEGRLGYPGPAAADLLRQFAKNNRLLQGGFVIRGEALTLADLTCPILAIVGLVDQLAPPAAVRGIRRAAPAASVYEVCVDAAHYPLVAGDPAETVTWPSTVDWIRWLEDGGAQPESIVPMAESNFRPPERETLLERWRFAGPPQARLGPVWPGRRVSLGRVAAERAPASECLIHDGRVHTAEAVNRRIDDLVRSLIAAEVRPAAEVGVVIGPHPGALVVLAAVSRLGAVAVLVPTGEDLEAALLLSGVTTVISDADHLPSLRGLRPQVLVFRDDPESGHPDATSGGLATDLGAIDPARVRLPDWYTPNPGRARDVAFRCVFRSDRGLAVETITNHQWAVSSYSCAASMGLSSRDTMYIPATLGVPSDLAKLGGALAGDARIAFPGATNRTALADYVRRYGVTWIAPAGAEPVRASAGIPREDRCNTADHALDVTQR